MLKLVCLSGNNKGDVFELKEGVNIVGRGADADVRLFDQRVSRHHCQILRKNDYYSVEDLDSRHGTYVDGNEVKRRRHLKEEEKLVVGHTTLWLSRKTGSSLLEQSVQEAALDMEDEKQRFESMVEDAAAKALTSQLEAKKKRKQSGLLGGLFGKDKDKGKDK